ncbi:type II secretion system protein GspJ, partial [Vibrio parahaemolyticus]|uniref:type II secretion system protein GspJ n=1 Tax=Vibrio parahaemolyticus TaxID=670 RepID=UPI001828B796
VETFEMRLSDGKKWSDEWDAENTLPAAVSVELTLKDYGKISRVYLTPEGTLQKRSDSGNQDSKDDNNG